MVVACTEMWHFHFLLIPTTQPKAQQEQELGKYHRLTKYPVVGKYGPPEKFAGRLTHNLICAEKGEHQGLPTTTWVNLHTRQSELTATSVYLLASPGLAASVSPQS